LQRIIRKGDVVYDIGANIGLYSRFIVQRFHASHVYAFEPIPGNRSMLAENLKIGNCTDRVTILPCAIGDEDGTAAFQVDDVSSGTGALDSITEGKASWSRRQYGLPPLVVHVTTSRLDTLLKTQSLPKPDVVKIDIEGAEALALEGARQTLVSHSPHLAIEIHGPEVGQKVLRVLWSLGYYCFGWFDPHGANVYKKLTPDDLKHITTKYSLPYLAASTNEADLTEPIPDFAI
jgi:FkbM family methyltransferase